MYRIRNLRSRVLFGMLEKYCAGVVLDVGGWEFIKTLADKDVTYTQWIVVEPDTDRLYSTGENVSLLHSDGCNLGIADNSIDTIVSLQVLEHVFEPIKMFEEFERVLKPGGYGIILLPTTATMHLAPHFHYNFSRYWIFEAVRRTKFELIEFQPLGGVWSSMASHLFYFFLQVARVEGTSHKDIRRSLAFWLLLPFQVLFAVIAIPFCMLFSLGDLQEEPNNHAIVVRKPV